MPKVQQMKTMNNNSHTPEQACQLWCPMARVAQIGATETSAAYNRALIKSHVPVRLSNISPEGFELGDDEPQPKDAVMLKTELQISGAARCIAHECALWRWTDAEKRDGFCSIGGKHHD